MNVPAKLSSDSTPDEPVLASQHDLGRTTHSTMSYWSCRQELVDEAAFSAERDCPMEEPEVFDVLVEDTPTSPRPGPPRRPTHQGSRICHYGGEHSTAWLMEHTRPLDDEQRWHEAATQHAPGCRWVLTREMKGGAPDATG